MLTSQWKKSLIHTLFVDQYYINLHLEENISFSKVCYALAKEREKTNKKKSASLFPGYFLAWVVGFGSSWPQHHNKSSKYWWNVTQFSIMRMWIHMNRLAHQEKQTVNNLLFSLGALPACNNPSHRVFCGPRRVLQMLHFLLQWLLRPDNLQQWAVSYPRAASYCKNRTAPVVLMR